MQVFLDTANMRIDWIFYDFKNIFLSFFGRKDSTISFHLMATIAKNKNSNVIFINLQAKYTLTIAHTENIKDMYNDIIETFYWVVLPLRGQLVGKRNLWSRPFLQHRF